MNDDEFKVCPFCNEKIEASVVNCPHCGRSLEAAPTSEGEMIAQAASSPDRDASESTPVPGKRIGLIRMNGALLLLYGYGLGANMLHGTFSHRGAGILLAIIFVGAILVAGCLFGFLAALNPAHEIKRKLAKCSNLLVIGLALFPLLRDMVGGGTVHARTGSVGQGLVYGFILSALIALPAVFNLRAFWKSSSLGSNNPVTGYNEGVPPVQAQMRHDTAVVGSAPPVISVRHRNYILRHWRGELSLGVSYWVNGLLGTFLVFLIASVLNAAQEQASLKLIAVLALIVYAGGIVVSVWQFVGVWRSASNHVSRGGKRVWAALAKLAVVLAALSGAVLLGSSYIPQSLEMASIIAGDKGIPDYQIRVLPGGSEMEFRGGIRAGSATALEDALSITPNVKVLHIESVGGRIDEARKMIELVRARGLTTYTAERCDSAATLVLIAGRERVVAAGAEVGFHQATLPGATDEQQREIDDFVRSTMQSAGVSEAFIDRVLATPHDQLWYPTVDEMIKSGVVTSQTYGERFANSWGGSNTNVIAGIQKLDSYPCFSAIRELDPEAFQKMTNDFLSAVRAGKSEGEALAVISETSNALMDKYLPSASDEALLALRDQWIEILVKYKDKNSRACISAFTGGQINYSRAFPDWDMTNSLRILEKVIRSGASRKKIRVNKKTALEDYTAVMGALEKKYGNEAFLLGNQEQWMDHSQKVCEMLLAMYQQIAALPDRRSANLVRSIATGKNK